MNRYICGGLLVASTLLAQSTQQNKDSFQRAPQTQQIEPSQTHSKLTIKQATMRAINLARSKPQICTQATTPLKWNPRLYTIAKEHSIDMAVTGKLQHNGSGTKTDSTATRLKLKKGSFFYERVNQKVASKNILSGELIIRSDLHSLQTPRTLINYWIKKPNDCKTIMDPRFTDVAMSKVISNKDSKSYWTLMLAGKRK